MDGIEHSKGETIKEALLVMLTISTDPFLVVEETKTRKFIQFASQDGEILIDFPKNPLAEPEAEKAGEYFQKNEIPFVYQEEYGGSWTKAYPQGDIDNVVNIAVGGLRYIFGFPEDFEFSLRRGWEPAEPDLQAPGAAKQVAVESEASPAMELHLNIDDDQTGETEHKVIQDPDDATIWGVLRQIVDQATEEPDGKDTIVILCPADETESILLYILEDEVEHSAPSLEGDEEPRPPPPPVAGEAPASSPALPEWRCYVEYTRAGEDGDDEEAFVTEELELPEVLEILQLYAKGDKSWRGRPEWKAKGSAAAVAETVMLNKNAGCGILYLVGAAFFIIWGIAKGCGGD